MDKTLLFRQLFDQASSTFTYLLANRGSREAVLIDTVYEQHERDVTLVRELGLRLLACIETHCHADHVSGAWLMQHSVGGDIVASGQSGIVLLDRRLEENEHVEFGDRHLRVLSTPGHTAGCVSLVLDDESMVFTGDCLLIRACGRTDFQEGSAKALFHSIRSTLFKLPDNCVIYPAHDYSGRCASTIGEEKALNPRIGGKATETDFVNFMENMRLPHPKKL
ncbi:MAG TPA: MBL fold metallo-hydrolase, partial [Woeseiaceae bacterium]|nr:MBL fold metallo-hydrolase [Woeseiaceae bacterium]